MPPRVKCFLKIYENILHNAMLACYNIYINFNPKKEIKQ